MRVRVADIDGQRIAPILLKDRHQSTFDLCKSIIPTYLHPLVTLAHHWLANAIWIGMQFFETIGFRANIAMAENILSISANGYDLTTMRFNLQSTCGFTKRTCCVTDLCAFIQFTPFRASSVIHSGSSNGCFISGESGET